MTPVKRRYRSPRRQEQAEATRRVILDTAIELFTSQGFAATTIREVAQMAAVSEQTVYNAFGDKIGLLHAAGVGYAESSSGLAEAAFLTELEAEPDPLERVRMVGRSSRHIWEGGAAELERMVLDPGMPDPRLGELAKKSLEYKHENTRATCAILFPDGLRRPGLELDDIAAFATAVDSGVTVSTLRSLGWSMDDWEAWIVELLTLFLDPKVFSDVPGESGDEP